MRLFLVIAFSPLLAALTLWPASAFSQEPDPAGAGISAADLLCCGSMTAIAVGIIGYLGWSFWKNYGKMDEVTHQSEASFEQALLREFQAKQGQESAAPASDGSEATSASGGVTPGESTSAEATDAVVSGGDSPEPVASVSTTRQSESGSLDAFGRFPTDMESFIQRLQQLTVLGDREGTYSLAIPPHGQIYRLRKGGTVVILPRLEVEATMQHLVRRFDVVVVLCPDGEHLVLGRLQTRLRELMDRPGDFEGPPLR